MAYWDDPGYQQFMRETYGGNWYTSSSSKSTSTPSSSSTSKKSSSSSTSKKSSSSSTATKTPSERELKNLTEALAQAKRTYEAAKARGDTATMETARRVADVLRSQGASETEANKMVYGRESGWYPGWDSGSMATAPKSSATATATPKPTAAARTPTGRTYDKYVRAYGVEGYAAQIRDKLTKGQPLDDPAAAAEFMRDHPEFDFGLYGGVSPSVSSSVPIAANAPSSQLQQQGQDVLNSIVEQAQRTIDAVTQQNQALQQTVSDLLNQLAQVRQGVQTPSMPVSITQPPQVEVPAGTEPQAPGGQEGLQQDLLQKGPSGFTVRAEQPTTLTAPSVDELYNIYKQVVGGEENPAIREYLASPQFQSVLGGNIPMWMSADPIWRLYLMRLGLLGSNTNEARINALRAKAGS